jgi:precorrin-2 dehydrogenase / sirohydrochlorin ferrochelatase
MGYLPIFADLSGRSCIVIGGGELAAAKVAILLKAGAAVTVISPALNAVLTGAAERGKVRHVARTYIKGDLRGSFLVYVAIDDIAMARRVAGEARELGIMVNVPDNPALCSFISPASFRHGDLQVAISTSGSSPAMARLLREHLEEQIGPQYSVLLEIMRRARNYLRSRETDAQRRADILRSLASGLLALANGLNPASIDEVLRAHLKADLAELGIELPLRSDRQSSEPAAGSGASR